MFFLKMKERKHLEFSSQWMTLEKCCWVNNALPFVSIANMVGKEEEEHHGVIHQHQIHSATAD